MSDDYYGYNSYLKDNGQRVRRLRRTQLSAEKLQLSKQKQIGSARDIGSRSKYPGKHLKECKSSRRVTNVLRESKTNNLYKRGSSKQANLGQRSAYKQNKDRGHTQEKQKKETKSIANHRKSIEKKNLLKSSSSNEAAISYLKGKYQTINAKSMKQGLESTSYQGHQSKTKNGLSVKQIIINQKQRQQIGTYSIGPVQKQIYDNDNRIRIYPSPINPNKVGSPNSSELLAESFIISHTVSIAPSKSMRGVQFQEEKSTVTDGSHKQKSRTKQLFDLGSLEKREIKQSEAPVPQRVIEPNKTYQVDPINSIITSRAFSILLPSQKSGHPKILKQQITNLESADNYLPMNPSKMNDAGISFKNLPANNKGEERASEISNSLFVKLSSHRLGSQNTSEYLLDPLQRIETHDLIISFLMEFISQSERFYNGSLTQRIERMLFLVQRKCYYQKSRFVKAIKGTGPNCFSLSGLEVGDRELTQLIQSSSLQEHVVEAETGLKQIFKDFQKLYRRIHRNFLDDPLIKLETPKDTFSKQIILQLFRELEELYPQIQHGQHNKQSISFTYLISQRVIEILELMFLLSEFAGRKVKPFQLASQINEFQRYYEGCYHFMVETVEYFQNL